MIIEQEILDLIDKVQSGDEEAGIKLLDIFKPLKLKMLNKYKNKLIDPQDVEQQINLVLYESFIKYDKTLETPVTKYITCYTYLNFWNWWSKEIEYIKNVPERIEWDIEDPENTIDSGNSLDEILSVIDDPMDKDILINYFVKGYTLKEISDEYNISFQAIHKRIKKSLKKIEKFLDVG